MGLNENLTEIKRQKDEYIIPENIKKNVTIYGVTGTLEEGGGELNAKMYNQLTYRDTSGSISSYQLKLVKHIIQLPSDLTLESNITSLANIFQDCIRLTSVPLFDTKNVTNMSYMFQNCMSLASVPQFNTSSVTNMSYMFYYCESLTTIPLIDTSSVTNMNNMFKECYKLESIPLLDLGKATNVSSMFNNCKAITTVPALDTSAATNMNNMFQGCIELVTVPALNTSSCLALYYAFQNCPKLSDESLNNIMMMCINTPQGYTRTKKLSDLGLSGPQIVTCQSLSNYDALLAAGWTAT